MLVVDVGAVRVFDRGLAQAGWWFWALLVAFSLSPEKRDLYLLPAYPAVALLASRWIVQAMRTPRVQRGLAALVPALLTAIGIALCGAGFFQSRLPTDFPSIAWPSVAVGWSRWLIAKEVPLQAGNDHPTGIPQGVFKTADGHITIAGSGNLFPNWRNDGKHILADLIQHFALSLTNFQIAVAW